VAPPTRIDWQLVKDVDAHGSWVIDPSEPVPEGESDACRVRFLVEFAPESADRRVLDLPRLIPFEVIVDRVVAEVRREAERVVRRLVADLEGEPREVTLDIHELP